ncbi:alpha/beta hydrolase [Paenibacillus sp. 2TAB23]|uniref:alpha/beta hydrolase n=1 Tax=Paenibacillus sp. 2TAB23 TaxID=3233004 RepID=UPI003F9A51E8
MAFVQVELFSETLGLSDTVHVLVPQRLRRKEGHVSQSFRRPYPVLYLLHGGSDNHTSWMRKTSLERYVEELGIVVVMPSVQYSFYADQKQGFPYFTYLSEELPEIIRDLFPVSGLREDTFAAGLSMGGYGAFKLGINCPERFAAVASLSGSIDQRDRLGSSSSISNKIMLEMARLTFGSIKEYEHSQNDLAWLLEQHLVRGTELPRFYMACGTKDHNYTINNDFFRQFGSRLSLDYEVAPERGHDWTFWDEYIQKVLNWLPIRGKAYE